MAVELKFSRDMNIHSMVYQGIVLGQPLWNVYYADAAVAMNLIGFMEIVSADDLKCFKDDGLNVTNETCIQKCTNANASCPSVAKPTEWASTLRRNQSTSLHWMTAKDVSSNCWAYRSIMHYQRDAVVELVSEAGWEITSILRSYRFVLQVVTWIINIKAN